jgi:hypothetical protein
MSSFWLILKQQWTIKFSSPLFPFFLAWWPSWLEVGITGHTFGRGPSKDHSTKVWFKLAQWLQRSWLKCETLTERTNGRTTDDGRSVVTIAHAQMTLVRWAKKYSISDDSNILHVNQYCIPYLKVWYTLEIWIIRYLHASSKLTKENERHCILVTGIRAHKIRYLRLFSITEWLPLLAGY